MDGLLVHFERADPLGVLHVGDTLAHRTEVDSPQVDLTVIGAAGDEACARAHCDRVDVLVARTDTEIVRLEHFPEQGARLLLVLSLVCLRGARGRLAAAARSSPLARRRHDLVLLVNDGYTLRRLLVFSRARKGSHDLSNLFSHLRLIPLAARFSNNTVRCEHFLVVGRAIRIELVIARLEQRSDIVNDDRAVVGAGDKELVVELLR